MTKNQTTTTHLSSSELNFMSALFILLLALKLTVREDLSWWVVFMPFWIEIAVLLCFAAIVFAFLFIQWAIEEVWKWMFNTRT